MEGINLYTRESLKAKIDIISSSTFKLIQTTKFNGVKLISSLI